MAVTVRVKIATIDVTKAPYNARGDGTTDDTAAIQAAIDAANAAGGGEVMIPEGEYRLTSWVRMASNVRLFGVGPSSILSNDKTNSQAQRQACLLPGLHHPALMSGQTKYALDNIAYGDPSVTCTTAGDAANFGVGDLVIVGSATNVSGVSRHAQLNKISAIDSGEITLVDPIEADISDAKIWTITGTDSSSGYGIYAVENVTVENLGFKGRSAFATKGAVFRGTFRDLTMHDVAIFFATNMLTNVSIERLRGQYCNRYLEFAFNSYNVTARDWKGRFTPPAGLQSGESMVLPIHLGEQPYRVLLDDVQCHVDSRFTPAGTELMQVKGSKITFRKCDFRHNGTAGSFAVNIPDCTHIGHAYEDITFDDCRLAAPGKARIALIGGVSIAAENPKHVHFQGGEMTESLTGESIWFRGGTDFSCSMRDRTGKTFKVSAAARYPMLNGYRRG